MKSGLWIFLILLTLSLIVVINACKKDSPEVVVPNAGTIDLKSPLSWKITSTPLRFKESGLINNVAFGFNRAKFSWYTIDPLFYELTSSLKPYNITNADISSDDCRYIREYEVFPSKTNSAGQPVNIQVFNLDFYPSERGSWNYDTDPSAYSSGIDNNGKLINPSTRWGGMMRKIEVTTENKINYIDFWMLDPFATSPDANGELYIDLGDISEDVLKDDLASGEYYTREGNVSETVWGQVWPLSMNFNFDDNYKTDYGLDELNKEEEYDYFRDYLQKIYSICYIEAYQAFSNDPSGDNYHFYRGSDYDELDYKIRQRYKNYNSDDQNSTDLSEPYPTQSTMKPDCEDINHNNILETDNNYFEYRIRINRDNFITGANYIVKVFEGTEVTLADGSSRSSLFYHFRIPVENFTAQYGAPSLTENPKFMRIYLTGFESPVNIRFITLEFSEKIVETEN